MKKTDNLVKFEEIQNTIVKSVNAERRIELSPQDIGHELFVEVAKAYLAKYKHLPENWKKYMENRNRFTEILLSNGHEKEDLKDLDLVELRDLCNEYEYIETVTATASGGVSVSREKLAA